MANVIIPKKYDKHKMAEYNKHLGKYGKETAKQYRDVSKENRAEYRQEKSVQELHTKGFNEAAISGMTMMPESQVKKYIKNKGNIVLDGKY